MAASPAYCSKSTTASKKGGCGSVAIASSLKCYALRLQPGEEIISSLQAFVEKTQLKAAFVMTCVGSVRKATLRLAHVTATKSNEVIEVNDCHEIVSLVGTLNDGGHLHAALSDRSGKVVGGHVLGDMVVFTTAEIVIGECESLQFAREFDEQTGFDELKVINRSES